MQKEIRVMVANSEFQFRIPIPNSNSEFQFRIPIPNSHSWQSERVKNSHDISYCENQTLLYHLEYVECIIIVDLLYQNKYDIKQIRILYSVQKRLSATYDGRVVRLCYL